ncbi:hypothetical protein ACHAWF_016152, partial [Thalassiosira exigua]
CARRLRRYCRASGRSAVRHPPCIQRPRIEDRGSTTEGSLDVNESCLFRSTYIWIITRKTYRHRPRPANGSQFTMNRLFWLRGAQRSSRCTRRTFQHVQGALSTSAWVQNLSPRQADPKRLRHHPAIACLLPRDPNILTNDTVAFYRRFSSLSVNTITDTVQSDNQNEIAVSETTQRPPSGLEQANLDVIYPGLALNILQKYAAKSQRHKIRQSDFVRLCESARPGKLHDGKVIATALREFKKNNKFVIRVEGTTAAVEGMLRAMIPTWKVQDGKPRLKGAMFVAEQLVDEKSGLYFAAETALADQILEEIHKGLLEMKENGIVLKIDTSVETEGELSNEEKMLKEALKVTGDVVNLLTKRRSRPENQMKKRARRVYLKILQVGTGPKKPTLELATKISLLIGGSVAAQENVVTPYLSAWWTKTIHTDTLQLIEEAAALETEQAKSAEDAKVAGGSEDANESEKDLSDDGEVTIEDQPNADADTEPEEVKKD